MRIYIYINNIIIDPYTQQGYERMNLCDALESKRFSNGQEIILQGDQANGMYFIESGVSFILLSSGSLEFFNYGKIL